MYVKSEWLHDAILQKIKFLLHSQKLLQNFAVFEIKENFFIMQFFLFFCDPYRVKYTSRLVCKMAYISHF